MYKRFYRRRLPHLQTLGSTLFVTFRLAGSIPDAVVRQLIAETERMEAGLCRLADPHERDRQLSLERRRLFGKWDAALDTATGGPFWLRDSQVAGIVSESMHHLDGKVYQLDAYCVMPNHVHLVCAPLSKEGGVYYGMPGIMHSLKRHAARQANVILGRQGEFWQHESYDHVIRDEEEWRRVIAYVLNNPVKAGLVQLAEEWKWNYYRPVGQI